VTQAAVTRLGPTLACLLCSRPVRPDQRRCPAFAQAGIPAHAGCCGGCATSPAPPELALAAVPLGVAGG